MHTNSLTDLLAHLRSGKLDLRAYVDATLQRVDRGNPELLAVLPEPARRTRLLRDAAVLLARYPNARKRPSLFGALVGVKDIIHVDELPTRAGSAVPAEALAGAEAEVVRRLRAAGALIFGKLVTTEFAYFEPGAARNPRNPAHTPGGSSSGSAASVGAGWLPLALGTQTVGSVIRPAAYCGVAGFKPSYGRIPAGGIIAFAPSVDTLGLFAADVASIALSASALVDDWQPMAAPRKIKLGVPDGPYLEQVEPAARASFEATLQRWSRQGVSIKRVPCFDDLADIAAQHVQLIQREFQLSHAARFPLWGALYRPISAATFERGRAVSDDQYSSALASCSRRRATLTELRRRNGFDCWVMPAAPGPAPLGLRATGDPAMNMPWSHIGAPAITFPSGEIDGLPLGVQLASDPGMDELVVAVAGALEKLQAMRVGAVRKLAPLRSR